MDRTRREMFSVLAAVPLAGLAMREAVATAPASVDPTRSVVAGEDAVAWTVPNYPIGWMTDSFEIVPLYPSAVNYSPSFARHVRMIWDGQRFVRFDSAEGTAVLNRLLTGRG